MPVTGPSAMVKWPAVPACYGWLSLSRRGLWLLKGEVISHPGLIRFISSHYAGDDSGNWIFRNGPQAVFVALDYAPFVLRLEPDGRLTAHTGALAGAVAAVFLDEEGSAVLETALGIGLLDDRDLPAFFAACRNAQGEPAAEADLLAAMTGGSGAFWRGLPLQAIKRRDLPQRYGFQPDPAP